MRSKYSSLELLRMDDPDDRGNLRFVNALDLWRARRHSPSLSRELPYPAHGYSNPFRAYQRIGQAASNVSNNFSPNYILGIEEGKAKNTLATVLGIATAEVREPHPVVLPGQTNVELSYWHSYPSAHGARYFGICVVESLLEQAAEMVGDLGKAWMVTLPSDQVKHAVLDMTGFEPVNPVQAFDIEDGVTEPRLLWTKEL